MHYILSSPRSAYGYSDLAKAEYLNVTSRSLDDDLAGLKRSDGNLVIILSRLGLGECAAPGCALTMVEVQEDIGLHVEIVGDGGEQENDKMQINGIDVTFPLNLGCSDTPIHGAALEAWCSDRGIPYPYVPE